MTSFLTDFRQRRMATYTRMPIKMAYKGQVGAIQEIGARAAAHRARSAAYHAKRRAGAVRDVVMVTAPVARAPASASTSRTEVKTFDCHITVPAANLPIVTAAAGGEPTAAFVGITEINDVRQGAGFNQRIGAKIVVKSVELTGEVWNDIGVNLAEGPVRYNHLLLELKDLAD